MKTSYLSPI
jgi:hypothetical protein